MDHEELGSIIVGLRASKDDGQRVEAKSAKGGFPKDPVGRSLCAFANTNSGVIVLGLDERAGFAASGVSDPSTQITKLADLANSCQPPVEVKVDAVRYEGVDLVVATVIEAGPNDKPVRLRDGTAFRRVGDQDQRLSEHQCSRLREKAEAPDHDCKPVQGTSFSDLDTELVTTFVTDQRQRRSIPDESDEQLLVRLRVLDKTGLVTVAGLLAMGSYPQQYLPNVKATFVHYVRDDGLERELVRFVDNRSFVGPIGEILRDIEHALKANMSRSLSSSGMRGVDHWEYPPVALREAVVNALVHRDLSPSAQGAQVQIEMYPSRLEIRNPGGLHGPVTTDTIDSGTSSARNSCLMTILEDVRVDGEFRICENRGSGIRVMLGALREAGMSTPIFVDDLTTFCVKFPANTLLAPEVIKWISGLRQESLTPSQVRGLAMLRSGEAVNNVVYRQATGVDSRQATNELGDLVNRGLARREGSKRWARYVLATPGEKTTPPTPPELRKEIRLLLVGEPKSRAAVEKALGWTTRRTNELLARMTAEGLVVRVGKSTSPKVKYAATEELELDETT